MKLSEIIDFLDERIPRSLALKGDEIGFKKITIYHRILNQ